MTHLSPQGVSQEIYDAVHGQLTEKEMSDLGFLIITINGWNRLCVAFQTTPGSFDAAFGLDKAGLQLASNPPQPTRPYCVGGAAYGACQGDLPRPDE